MNKTELVSAVAEAAGVSKKDVEAVLSATKDAIFTAVAENDKVQLVGFGTFEQRQRDARTGINPRSGEKIEIAASKVPAFKAGKAFKDAVNK